MKSGPGRPSTGCPLVDMVNTLVRNLSLLKPSKQREIVLGVPDELVPSADSERAIAVTSEQSTLLAPGRCDRP